MRETHDLMFTPTRNSTWRDLVRLSDPELAQLDIASVHLLCADGLPSGAYGQPPMTSLGIPRILAWIDTMTEAVRQLTDALYPRRGSLPEEFRRSEAIFRMACLVSVVRRDFGIHGDNRLNQNPNFSDSRYLFLHGIYEGCGGTCATLPVLYAAIARRLGYPLYLVRTNSHLFARWQATDGERFNLECTSPGLDCPPDWHYLVWPFPVDPRQAQAGKWLVINSPREELGGFLIMRSACLRDSGRLSEAIESANWACKVAPENLLHRRTAERLFDQAQQGSRSWHPGGVTSHDPYDYPRGF